MAKHRSPELRTQIIHEYQACRGVGSTINRHEMAKRYGFRTVSALSTYVAYWTKGKGAQRSQVQLDIKPIKPARPPRAQDAPIDWALDWLLAVERDLGPDGHSTNSLMKHLVRYTSE